MTAAAVVLANGWSSKSDAGNDDNYRALDRLTASMSVIANLAIPADAFVLGDVLDASDGMTVHLESMVPTGNVTVPYFWVNQADADRLVDALDANPVVDAVRVIDRTDEEALLRVDWSSKVNGLIDALTATAGVVLKGTGAGDRWQFRVRFSDYDELSRFYQQCVDSGISVDITRVHDMSSSADSTDYDLSDAQRQALEAALDEGYFDVPRGITLVDLAERLDISDSAVSQRIRRGLGSLVATTIVDDPIKAPPSLPDDVDQ